MKKLSLSACILLTAAITTQPVLAASKGGVAQAAQRGTIFTTSAIVGGILGGPIGLFAGAIGGALVAEKSKEAVATKEELVEANNAVANLESQVTDQEQEIAQLEERQNQTLAFQVMFTTGGDTLSSQDAVRISALANHLAMNKDLKVTLEGHADSRGSIKFNEVLSLERARAVEKALMAQGIEQQRIEVASHGESQASSVNASADSYALERRVDIEVSSRGNRSVAAAH